jgi:ankyrin repeat protein
MLLFCQQAALNGRDKHGCTPLMRAASAGNATAAVELLQRGAWADVHNHQGLSALHIACMGSQTNVASALLAAGASVNLCTADGTRRSPLFAAVVAGSVSTVTMLLAYGALVDSRDSDGTTSLIAASERGMADIVTMLLRAGALADYQRCADARCTSLLRPEHLAPCFEHKRVTWIVSDSKQNRDSFVLCIGHDVATTCCHIDLFC